jgi:DnaJ domain
VSNPTRYPLQWPVGWKRTPESRRAFGKFGTQKQSTVGSWKTRENLTIAQAARRLQDALERMAVNRDSIILSTDLRLNLDGSVRSAQAQPRDPGAAVYWKDPYTGQARCMAIDLYTKVEQNIAALAATIDAMRAIERHGGAAILDRAFTGFTALPPPIVAGMARPWWEVLKVPRDAKREDVKAAYRRLASAAHPDKGGTEQAMAELNVAQEQALKECHQ